MSLTVDGVWKVGVWATTVWADGVWSEGGAPPAPAPTVTNNFAGGWHPHLWIAHINGKRYVGTYEEIEAIAEGVVEATEKRPRIVIKPLRKAPEGASVSQEVMAAPMQEAKQVQAQIYMDLMPFLAKLIERRRQEDEDDIETILAML